MKIRLFTIGKTQVLLHTATLLFGAYMALCGKAGLFCVAMTSILLHEGAHGIAAWASGECPYAIEITPLGAVMRLEDEARLSPLRRFMMLAAGPCMTLILCMAVYTATKYGVITKQSGQLLFTANAGILALNLLPCLPLDGGRLLALGLERTLGQTRMRRVMRRMGIAMGIGCISLSLIVTLQTGKGQFTLAACGCVILYAARASTGTMAMAELAQMMERKIRMEQRGLLPVHTLAVMEDCPLRQVAAYLPGKARVDLTILEKGSLRIIGRCDEAALIAAYLDVPGENCRILIK